VLGHDWESAEGICVDIRTKGSANSGSENRGWLMEIRCGDAEPFRVELGVSGFREDFKGPERGETYRMLCDVKRQEAKWDFSDPGLSWKADRHARAERFEAELKEKPQA
jgi:hypothetical protein